LELTRAERTDSRASDRLALQLYSHPSGHPLPRPSSLSARDFTGVRGRKSVAAGSGATGKSFRARHNLGPRPALTIAPSGHRGSPLIRRNAYTITPLTSPTPPAPPYMKFAVAIHLTVHPPASLAR
jgi:hypothetical protein